METDGKWLLMIFRNGCIRYATSTDGDFRDPKEEPYRFPSKAAAIAAYNRWVDLYPEEQKYCKVRFMEDK